MFLLPTIRLCRLPTGFCCPPINPCRVGNVFLLPTILNVGWVTCFCCPPSDYVGLLRVFVAHQSIHVGWVTCFCCPPSDYVGLPTGFCCPPINPCRVGNVFLLPTKSISKSLSYAHVRYKYIHLFTFSRFIISYVINEH